MMKMKTRLIMMAACILTVSMLLASCAQTSAATKAADATTAAGAAATTAAADTGAVPASADGEYYMISFFAGAEYFKGCFTGFEAAAKEAGVKAFYMGSPGSDLNAEVTVLEQVIAKNPKGIAVSCVNPDGLKDAIDKANAAGIPVVCFDADSPQSTRYSFLGTGNYYAGTVAAKALGDMLGGKGEVGVLQVPGLLNLEQRAQGFKDTMAEFYPEIKIVQTVNGNLDQAEGAKVTAGMIQAYPNLAGIFGSDSSAGVGAATAVKEAGLAGKIKIIAFDTDTGTLDLIKEGVLSGSIAQGTYNMGWWSFQMLFNVNGGAGNFNPVEGWKEFKMNPLPPSVDTGVVVVTKDNVESFYAKT
ncbi:MAG: substrate-binding domain-containing protein [Eubacteriales bacterium]